MKRIYLFLTIFAFVGCTPKSVVDGVGGIFVDEEVVHAKGGNYSTASATSNTPIIKEQHIKKTSPQESSQTLSKTGQITSSSYDPDVKLYIYTFESNDGEMMTFFYSKKLPYLSQDLLRVTIKDNFLTNYSKLNGAQTLNPTQKKIKFLHKKRINSNIQTPVEEKISTF